jgi:hypothetical protein
MPRRARHHAEPQNAAWRAGAPRLGSPSEAASPQGETATACSSAHHDGDRRNASSGGCVSRADPNASACQPLPALRQTLHVSALRARSIQRSRYSSVPSFHAVARLSRARREASRCGENASASATLRVEIRARARRFGPEKEQRKPSTRGSSSRASDDGRTFRGFGMKPMP